MRSRFYASAVALAAPVALSGAASAQTTETSAPPGIAAAQDAASSPSQADAGKGQLEDIVVTAQRRSERLQDVPVAVTSLSSGALTQQGVTSTTDLSQAVPSLVVNNGVGVANPFIRGIGSDLFDPTSESPVAIYVDDVYLAAPQANVFSLAGTKQIDVLNGPQGTLFGRNATGGVIQIQTLDPTHAPHLDASVSYGSYDYVSASVYGSVGVSDTVSTSLSAQYEDQGKGFGRNLFNGADLNRLQIDNVSVRNKWMIELPTGTVLRLSGDYSRSGNTIGYQRGRGSFSDLPGATPPTGYVGAYNANIDFPDSMRVRSGGVSLKVDHDFGPMSIASITAYRESRDSYKLDEDQSTVAALNLAWKANYKGFSQELRLTGRTNPVFNWMVGGFYYNARGSYRDFMVNGATFIPFDQQKTESIAGFAQATLKLLENTKLTGGVRYTKDTLGFTFPAASLKQRKTFTEPTFRVALEQHFTHDILAYVSFNTGFKSGGYALLTPGNGYEPEKLTAYEIGLKTEWLDHTLRLNMDGFLYRYKDQQVNVNQGLGNIIANAAGSHISGFEANADYVPTSRLKFSGGVTFLRGHYTDYPGYQLRDTQGNLTMVSPTNPLGTINARGYRTIRTPAFVGSISAQYTLPTGIGDFAANVGVQRNSGYNFVADDRVNQPSYTILNAGLSWSPSDGPFEIRVWGKNLTDATYFAIANPNPYPVGDTGVQAPPRTVGVTASYKY
jgi:iron complex outermembrane receptor protein